MGITAEKLLIYCFLSLSLSLNARSFTNPDLFEVKESVFYAKDLSVLKNTVKGLAITPSAFVEAAKKNNIAQREFKGLKGLKNGYYVIAGIYGEIGNAKKAVNKLRKKGFETNYISVPESGMNYVYLNYHEKWQNAIKACNSQFNGKFVDAVWIMNAQSESKPFDHQSTKTRNSDVAYAPKAEREIGKANKDDQKSFLKIAKAHHIPTRKLSNLEGVKNGYYIVSGIFGEKDNAQKMTKNLRKKGFNADYFPSSENNLNYAYLAYHKNWENAILPIKSKFNGSYKDKVWVLQVENHPINKKSDIVDHVSAISVDKNALGSLFQKTGKPQKKNKLLEKADSYFNKMWYAEAAELYEQILEQGQENYTFEIIQKAGDSHYFNTNMEKAYHWYNILYDKYKDHMSADTVFKYAHSLKGTGKYARAKRLMRIYSRKMKNPRASSSEKNGQNVLPTEVVLDELRNTTQDYDVFNLAINSKYSEFSPMFYNEEQLVFASANDTSIFNSRRYKWNDQPYLDLYMAKINKESQELRDVIKFSKKVNTKYHEASVTFSPDNETMFFTRNNYVKKLKRDKKGVNHLKIYSSKKINGEWTEAKEVPFNSDSYSTGHPALSHDGKLLYFVSDMPGSIGQTDIFVVDVLENGRFSEPRNLGPGINTERKEMFPFINKEKLYFSSNGHIGLGGLDIFEAAIDKEQGFLPVKNVGQPLNSNKDDFSYIVNEENQKGFFASNRRGGKGDDDIYSFKKLVVEEVPENLNAIAGVVTELVSGEFMPKALVTLLDENNIKLKEMVAEDDGSFLFEDLEGNTKYTIKTSQGDYFDEEVLVSTKDNEVVNTEIAMRRLKEMIAVEEGIRKLKTEMIYFDFDKSYIRKDASEELDRLVQVMTENPNMVIKIESHTDSRGAKAYNKHLSDKRAKSTRNYIISKGIEPSRIQSAMGFGEERLINGCDETANCSEANHLLNRRSEFVIVKM